MFLLAGPYRLARTPCGFAWSLLVHYFLGVALSSAS